MDLVCARGGILRHLDVTVICEAPRPTTPTGMFYCSAAFSASLPGPTKVVITATVKRTESPKSNVLAYNFQPIP